MGRHNRMRWRRFALGGPWQMPFPGPDAESGDEDRLFWMGPKGGPPAGPPFPFFGGPPFDDDQFWRGGRRRQRRGDIKYALLELLAERPRHGYELIKELEQRFGGFYRPSPGTVYPTLQLLEEEGHLTVSEVAGKKVYSVTESGHKLLAERQGESAHSERHHGPWEQGGFGGPSPELKELRERGRALMGVLQQIGRHGTPAQIRAAAEQLDATRRELYRLLAEDEGKAEG